MVLILFDSTKTNTIRFTVGLWVHTVISAKLININCLKIKNYNLSITQQMKIFITLTKVTTNFVYKTNTWCSWIWLGGQITCIRHPPVKDQCHNFTLSVLCQQWAFKRVFVEICITVYYIPTALINWVQVLRPTRYKTAHFGDVLPSQSLGIVRKKLNLTQQKQTYKNKIV